MIGKKTVLFLAAIIACLSLQAKAVSNYQLCFQCFYNNRVGYEFCKNNGVCQRENSLGCSEENLIKSYFDCPQKYVTESCGNYTFTDFNFDMSGEFGVQQQMRLNEGEACFMTIDRTTGGSYGTMRIQYDNPYIMVFDEYVWDFASDDYVGLIETSDQQGWLPRTILVVNAGLIPTLFTAVFEGAMQSLTTSFGLAFLVLGMLVSM